MQVLPILCERNFGIQIVQKRIRHKRGEGVWNVLTVRAKSTKRNRITKAISTAAKDVEPSFIEKTSSEDGLP